MHAVQKYLGRYAEPEIELARSIDGRYDRSLVVPAFREEPSFVDGFVAASDSSGGRTLAILVVNAPVDSDDAAHAENARLLDGILSTLEKVRTVSTAPRAWLGNARGSSLDALVIDRATPGARLPSKRGVGLARKIGTDVALALQVGSVVAPSFIFGTDADATLPEGHFGDGGIDARSASAVVFPFWHDPAPDHAVTRATALYELSLRYYVAGLAWAGSPYAFHTLGSATAVSGLAYAKVRGYPRREAAEDFYLLNKIAKVGRIVRSRRAAVKLRSRASTRTPFGTGSRVVEAVARGDRDFYSPLVFGALRRLLFALDAFAEHTEVDRLYADIDGFELGVRDLLVSTFDELGARFVFEAAARELRTVGARRLRVHSWFDAFRTLKLVHALRDRCFSNVPWQDALAGAPFRGRAPSHDAAAARLELARAERELPIGAGPTLPGVRASGSAA